MNPLKSQRSATPFLIPILCSLFLLPMITGCQSEPSQSDDTENQEGTMEEVEESPVVEISTQNMNFKMPDTISSGWNHLVYHNQSPQTHFFTIERYPEGTTLKDIEEQVIPIFDRGMELINEGKPEKGFEEFGNLPEWFSEMQTLGGSGLVSPGKTSETLLNLEPGHYFIECYVKMKNGVFHSSKGMFSDFYVSGSSSGLTKWEADQKITISTTNGYVIPDTMKAGEHTFSVFFEDQKLYGNFAGHDINLARLSSDADIKGLEAWMNWVDPKGLIEPAPEGATFLGGVNNMPAGGMGYFKATLEPGRYIFIAEIPEASKKGMMKVVEVIE